jgi:DNA-binding NtrC family response regulator
MQTVLIAEDRNPLGRRLDERLSADGYFTILAETGEEALAVLRTVRVDALLARERLADIEGTVLAELVRRRGQWELAIVLEAEDGGAARAALDSGVVDAIAPQDLDVDSIVRLIRKLLSPAVSSPPPSADPGDTCVPALA